MKKHKNGTIRDLEYKARGGDIKAAFQLAEYYKKGQFVAEDKTLAAKYAKHALAEFEQQSLQVSSIKLTDFRAFQSTEFHLCHKNKNQGTHHLTVIVGINGAGKTTVLDAITKSFSWLTLQITSASKKGGRGDVIEDSDIHVGAEYASIVTRLSLNKNTPYDIELSKAKKGSDVSRKNNVIEIRQLADSYKYANAQNPQFNLPIMAYYSIERSLDINKKDTERLTASLGQQENKFDGYHKALQGTADFIAFFKWFKQQEEITLFHNGAIAEQAMKAIKIASDAIETFMPEFKNIRLQRPPLPLDMLLDKGEISLSVLQLSQGEKSLLALIMDMTHRLMLLNPSLDNPLHGNGVVLIDEIDLHLHPAWQQRVIPSLLGTFPNIQFIVTTHSPQVLSTIPKKCIRVLGDNFSGQLIAAEPIAFSYGEPSHDILQAIMHVDPQPPIPEKEKLDELTSLVDQGQYQSEQAKILFIELKKTLSQQHPQLLKIERSIRRQEALKE